MSGSDNYRAIVPFFLDGELRGHELQDFKQHLADCSECRDALAQDQGLSQLLRENRCLYHASEDLRGRVSAILLSEARPGLNAPGWLRRRILRLIASPLGGFTEPAPHWKRLMVAGLATILVLLFVPPTMQRVRASAFVETAAATHRSYLEGHLPLEIHSSSAADVTAWFAGKVPFHFQLPESQQTARGNQIYQLVGSRLVNFRGSYAALTAYKMKEQDISLLVISDNSARAEGGEAIHAERLTFHYHTVGKLNVITWSDHGLTYALVSSLAGSAQQSCLVCHENMADHLKFSPAQ